MGIPLLITGTMPNGFRIPGVISGMRVFLSSENNIGISSGIFVSASGDLLELRRNIRDIVSLPEGSDVVILTASTRRGGICFHIKELSIVDNDEIALAMIKILRSPATSTSDVLITHTMSSSNLNCSKFIKMSATTDGVTGAFDFPFRFDDRYKLEVKAGNAVKKKDRDFVLSDLSNEDGYRYTSIVFNDPPAGSKRIYVNITIDE